MAVEQLIIFVKAPRPGVVKTRLAATLGETEAAAAYRKLVETLLSALAELREVEIRFAPEDAGAELRPWLRTGWQLRPQGQGSLGGRMHAAFVEAFDRGDRSVVVIGSDCPYVTTGDIRQAWSALISNDVVIGPAQDGGYWLIGLRQAQAALFDGIAWSTDTVSRDTLRIAEADGLKVKLLRRLTDVDTEADWCDFVAGQAKA